MSLLITKGRAKYRIDRDPHQFTLEKYSKAKDGTDTWLNIGYYSDLKYLIRKLIFLHVMDHSKLEDISKVMDKTCQVLADQVSAALKRAEA